MLRPPSGSSTRAERPPVPSEGAARQLVERPLKATEASASGSAPTPLAPTASSGPPIDDPAASDPRTVALGADHGGYALKQAIARALAEKGYGVTDCGTTSTEAVDYPDFAHVVARLVASGSCSVGIIIDGGRVGSAMAPNKGPGGRAANAPDT